MRTVKVGQMTLTLGKVDIERPGYGYVKSSCRLESTIERDTCKHCGKPDCCYSCDMSVAQIQDATSKLEGQPDTEEEVADRLRYNGALKAIEAMVLNCAVAGFDVRSAAFIEAVETSLDSAVLDDYD